MNTEDNYSSVSAHWGKKYQRQCLLNVTRHVDGSITGTQVGMDNGFTSRPDREVTLSAEQVKRLRIKFLNRGTA